MPNVEFIRPELKSVLPQYSLIDDCVEGEQRIKSKKEKYLPIPNADDTSDENVARYDAYLTRAVFYNVTQRTLKGLSGQIFAKEPNVKVPSILEPVLADANGNGSSLVQLSKKAANNVIAKGRGGLFVDYPITAKEGGKGAVTVADLESGSIRPTINFYKAKDIINWRLKARGAKLVYSLVVLVEEYVAEDDGFEIKLAKQWRVLRLTEDDLYEVTIYRKQAANFEVAQGPFYPTDASGNSLNEIPFTFIGAENNDSEVDLPPLYDLASMNIAHYRNSADYEEACFIVGQPTTLLSGLTKEWVDSVLGGTVRLGSRAVIPMPENADGKLLQASPNAMPKEGMEHKERQMVALGAKLVEQKTVQRTAKEASMDNASETSVLASSANNVSEGIIYALKWCLKFLTGSEEELEFELNTDFELSSMTEAERKQLIEEWQSGAICFEEMRYGLRRAGIATLEDDEAKLKIDAEGFDEPDLDDDEGSAES